MSEFRRRLLAKKDNDELKENEILAVYKVTTIDKATRLLGNSFTLSNITKMKINGVQVTPTKTYTFNEIGEIPVIMTINPNATSLAYMFGESALRFADMSKFEALKVTNLLQAFHGTWSLKEVIVNTPNVNNMQSVLSYSSFKKFTFSNTSKLKNAHRMFCGSTITNIELFDTSSATNMEMMFADCVNIETIPQLDTSSATNMTKMFTNCKKLSSIPLLDTRNVTTMLNMFYGCVALKTIPQFNTSNVSNIRSLFCDCSSLETIPQLDTRNVTTMYWMFRNCRKLVSVPLLDATNVTNTWAMFENCTSLKNLGGFKNLSIGLNLSNSNLLTPLSVHNIIEQASGNFTLTLNSTAKTNWQNSEYFFEDYLMLREKNITISGLTTINIPEGVTTIPDNAFSGLTYLTRVTIPEGVTTIGNNAFANCTSLTNITIPSTVTYIGDNAFSGCVNISTITMDPTTAPTLGENVWGDNESNYVGNNVSSVKYISIKDESIGYDTDKWNVLIDLGFNRTKYAYIEYIESNSDAWIDTGVFVNDSNYRIECEFMATKFTANGSIFADYYEDSVSITRLLINATNKLMVNYRGSNNTLTIGNVINNKITSILYSNKLIINGTEYDITSNTYSTNNQTPIILFNRGRDTIIHRDIGARIYWFKVYYSNELILDMTPVRIGNVGYMYDRVRGQLFGNSGTGEFTLGANL